MGDEKGAVVVMEADTGKILAMVSKPSFDPNSVEDNWEYLNADNEQSPLLNRAMQGAYAPGSIFKIVTALEYIRGDRPMVHIHMIAMGKLLMMVLRSRVLIISHMDFRI